MKNIIINSNFLVMRRRGAGISALTHKKNAQQQFKTTGQAITTQHLKEMHHALQVFRESLEVFARKHKRGISRDPMFRHQFQNMCMQIGVDPLASNKGFWAELLGVGDFYFELAVQLLDVCITTRQTNGGLIHMDELIERLERKHGTRSKSICSDDVLVAVKKCKVLGSGLRVVNVKRPDQDIGHQYISSMPEEFSADHIQLILTAESHQPFVTCDSLAQLLSWPHERLHTAIRWLMAEGLIWVDMPEGVNGVDQAHLYFPCIFYSKRG